MEYHIYPRDIGALHYPHPDCESAIHNGNCFNLVKQLAPNSVDLAVTSPPYADARKATYGGVPPDQYVDWFMPLAQDLLDVVKPTGSFVLNIKEKVVNGERHTYVLDLIHALRGMGWLWTEEYIWHKSNSMPGFWPNRLRDSWERCLHFTRERKFAMYQDAVKVPIGDWAGHRLKNLSVEDKARHDSDTGSKFGRNISAWVGRKMVLPSNVLHFASECTNRGHSAAFPENLSEFFIKLFTVRGDVVLDPFAGSGTTCAVAKRLDRRYIGFELNADYHRLAMERLHHPLAVGEPRASNTMPLYS